MPVAFREKIAAQPPQKWNPSGVDDAISSSRDIFAAVRAATLDNDRFFKYVTVWFSFCRKSGQYYSTGVEGAIEAGWNPDEVIANLYPHWSLIGNNSYTVDNVHTLLAVIGNTKRYFFDEPRRFSRLSGFSSNYYMQNPFPLGTDRHDDLQNLLATLGQGAKEKGVPFGVSWGLFPEIWYEYCGHGSASGKDTSVPIDVYGPYAVDYILGGVYGAGNFGRTSIRRIYDWFYGSENNPAFGAKFDTISFSIWELGYAINFLLNKYREQAQIDILTDPWGCFDPDRPFNSLTPDKYYQDKLEIQSEITSIGGFPQGYQWWKVPRVHFSVEKYMGDALRYVNLYMVKPDNASDGAPEAGEYFIFGDGTQFGSGEDYRQYLMAAYNASPNYPEA